MALYACTEPWRKRQQRCPLAALRWTPAPQVTPLAMLVAAPRVAELVSGCRWPNPLTIARKRLSDERNLAAQDRNVEGMQNATAVLNLCTHSESLTSTCGYRAWQLASTGIKLSIPCDEGTSGIRSMDNGLHACKLAAGAARRVQALPCQEMGK
ncbi:hypothetical protein TESG_02330 [Trichophyton tonsurans CBS 112818]|uniref:Uncharacterized protein n=1 Tax=Trichophyton tonsurans (strain CBS 112818) TaxID=647933 RepID=F2RU29_TRIT1|nr:hypothetical protein TESG_02330 [Trichophyton tonsurans CBS 112818]